MKSVSRFARNTLELLETTRELKELGVVIVFEEQGIDTSQMLGEMQLTMFALAAQEESTSTSKNIRRSYQMRMERGTYITNYAPYGYRLVNGALSPHPSESQAVKHIFDLYLAGNGLREIVRILNDENIPPRRGDCWKISSISYILSNASVKIGLRQKPLQQEGTGLVLFHFQDLGGHIVKNKAKIIAICNQKGGVGKTVTTVNLGIGLARQGNRILLVDVDAQGSLTASLGYQQPDKLEVTLATLMGKVIADEEIRPGEGILHHEEGVDLLPANIELAGLETTLVNAMSREFVLKEHLKTIRDQYDVILLDCCPSLGMLTINALTAADAVIVPLQAHYLSLKGLEQLMRTIGQVKRRLNPALEISGLLVTMADMRTTYTRDIVDLLRLNYGDKIRVFDTIIPRSIRAAETSAEGKSIFLHDPSGKVSEAYIALTQEVAS